MKNIIQTFLLLLISINCYSQNPITLDCHVYGDAATWSETAYTQYLLNGEIAEYNGCSLTPAFMVAVIDPNNNCEPWGTAYDNGFGNGIENANNEFGNDNDYGACRDRIENYFVFRQTSVEQLDSLEQLLLHKIPNGYHLLIYSWIYLDSTEVATNNPNLLTLFQNMGWLNFGLSQNYKPFILYQEMGNPASAQEVYGAYTNDTIQFSTTFNCSPILSGVGITDKPVFDSVNLFPNPTNDVVNLNIGELKGVKLNVYNMQGQLVYYQDDLNSSEHIFSLGTEKGVFIVELLLGDTVKRYKLVKQ
jgi:hypothetical protein